MTEFGGTLAIIPARMGSKRLPGKNMLPLAGKPLISWTIEAALACDGLDTIIVTSDDERVLELAQDYGVVPHERCSSLCTDEATSADVIKDVLQSVRFSEPDLKTAVLLQPTSPLRQAADIKNALDIYISGGSESVVSITPMGVPLGVCVTLASNGTLLNFDCFADKSVSHLSAYRINGAVYVFNVSRFRQSGKILTSNTLVFEMPPERSVDIDTKAELARCEAVLSGESLC